MKKIVLLYLLSFISVELTSQNYQFLGTYSYNGTPNYLESPDDIVPISTLELIDGALPESYPVPDYNPHYISSGYDTDIFLEDSAEVYVTFVSEGAGYRNVLGFYTYDINSPPITNPSPEDITIIFPNISALGSGGGLQTGNKVKLGNFTAGTGIGWVLLANGWNGNVTSGLWQLFSNPNFNPESDPNLKYHNVLLSDTTNELIILGFEDIRRDYSSCDNDFNDAIFYVTSNPFSAISTANMANVSSATNITSASNGGLESEGSLANKIAKRNFQRAKNNSKQDLKQFQKEFNYNALNKLTGLNKYFPKTGLNGTETAHISSPEDLLHITNATDVFSVDIYNEISRVSAALVTKTNNKVYDHTKIICDRLNNSSLEDIRTVDFRGYKLISTQIKRSSGELENTLTFSILLNNNQNTLYSFWDIEDYPKGDYLNFQIWGSSFPQVYAIAHHIIDQLILEKPLLDNLNNSPQLPSVFIKSGFYKNGELNLTVINKKGVKKIEFNGVMKTTEQSDSYEINKTINLTGEWNENLIIETGSLFDIGFSITNDKTAQNDVLYLADGPWGIDYLDDYVEVDEFFVYQNNTNSIKDAIEIERQVELSGQVKGNINLFRHLKSGNQLMNVNTMNTVEFEIQNSMPVEIIIIPNNAPDWVNRLRYTIPVNQEKTVYSIHFNSFKDQFDSNQNITQIKSIVFSIIGDYQNYQPFSMAVNQLKFKTQEHNVDYINREKVNNFPNPCSSTTTFSIPKQSNNISIKIFDILGKLIDYKELEKLSNENLVQYSVIHLDYGLYYYSITDDNKNNWRGAFVKE